MIHTVLTLQNSFSPSAESSRPKPERLIPPKGSSGVDATMALTKTGPASSSSMKRWISASSVRPHARAESERGGVGHREGGGQIRHPFEQGHGPEELLLGHPHVRRDAGEHRRREEPAGAVDHLSPAVHRGPLAPGVLDLGHEFGPLRLGDEGADVGGRVEGVAHQQRVHGVGEAAQELVGHRLHHDEALGGDAGLPVVLHPGLHGRTHGRLQVGRREHDERVGPTELEHALLARVRRPSSATDMPARSLPVRVTAAIRGSSMILATSLVSTKRLVNTPSGTPARRKRSSSSRAVCGTFDACLSSPTLPTMRAGAANRTTCHSGKFHGMMASTGPRGW